MKASAAVIGERYPWQVGALFENQQQASEAADAVSSEGGLESEQIRLIKPEDANAPDILEPQSRGIGRTLVKAHLVLGGIGALVGLLFALALLLFTDVRAFTSSPAFSIGLLTALGLIAGLLLGGLVTLRPDQDVLRLRLAKAMGDGERWAVVVHARDHGEESRARKILEGQRGEIVAVL